MHDLDHGGLVSRKRVESGEYKLVDQQGNPVSSLPPPERWVQAHRKKPEPVPDPSPPAQQPPPMPAANDNGVAAADVVMPTFSDAEGSQPGPVVDPPPDHYDDPSDPDDDDDDDGDGSVTPAESIPGVTSDCPSCGVLPRVCPEGHTYYEGSSLEECGELVDVWVYTCQAIAQAARGSEPIPIQKGLRDRFARVIQRTSRRFPPMSGKIEIPLLLAATATSCTRPAERVEQEAEIHEPAPANTNGHARRAAVGVEL